MDSSKALIVNNSNNVIPVGIQLAGDLKKLSNDIKNGQGALQTTLDELGTSSVKVAIERNWIGQLKKSSVEENLKNVYSNLSYYIGKCGEALQNTNDNLSRSLDLIKLLALVEKDLYEHLDDQIMSNNELKNILLDWFKKQGINDDEVRELLESSFQRAYTLRDRINLLRQECRSSIAKCENRLLEFESKHNSIDVEIAKIVTDSINKLQSTLDTDINLLSQLYNKKRSSLLSLCNEQTSKMQEILKNYDIIVKKYEAETKRLYNEFVQSRDEAIKDVCDQAEQAYCKIQTAHNELENNVKCSKDNLQKMIDSFKIELEEFKKQQAELFEDDRKKMSVKLKRIITWTVIASISLSTVLSYTFSHLL